MKSENISYTIESALLAIASSFPLATSLATGWSQWKNYKQTENIKSLFLKMAEKIQSIEEKVDYDLLKSEIVKELLENTCLKISNLNDPDKTEIFAAFIVNSVASNFPKFSYRDIVLESLDKIDVNHLRFLKLVDKPRNQNKKNEIQYFTHFFTNVNIILGNLILYYDNDFIFNNLDYLKSIGLLQDLGSPLGEKSYSFTHYGFTVYEYITSNNLLDGVLLKKLPIRHDVNLIFEELSKDGFKGDGSLEDFLKLTTNEKKFNPKDAERFFNENSDMNARIGLCYIYNKKLKQI